MATYVSELRRNADTKKVKISYKDGTTIVEKIVVGKPISLSDVRGNLLRDLNDVSDSDGVALGKYFNTPVNTGICFLSLCLLIVLVLFLCYTSLLSC